MPTTAAKPLTRCWTPASASPARSTRPSTARWTAQEPSFDGEKVILPACTDEARKAYADSGMLSAAQAYEHRRHAAAVCGGGGGQQLFCLRQSISIGSNLLTVGNANLLLVHGTPMQQQVFADNEFNGRWAGTMCAVGAAGRLQS